MSPEEIKRLCPEFAELYDYCIEPDRLDSKEYMQIFELILALTEARKAQEWRPIAEAPKDGTLLWLGNTSKGWRHLGCWLTQEKIEEDEIGNDFADDLTDGLLLEGWHEYQTGHSEYDEFYIAGQEPDCFQFVPPLPQPPKEGV